MKFKIGDTVWVARAEPLETWVPCPDCLGQKALTIIYGDGSQASVECTGCKHGYEPPSGVVLLHEYKARVHEYTITGVDARQSGGKIEVTYWFGSGAFNEENTFANVEEAQKRAHQLIAEHTEKERLQSEQRKEYNHKTWAWNVTYHRCRIRMAQKDLNYHTAKLNVAKVKAKEDKP